MTSRILVVDDNPLNVKLLEAKLSLEYYIVTTAGSGDDALEKLTKDKPDLILLDVMMPGLDGFETCRRIKDNKETSHIPVVMVTALSDVADRVKGLEAGADDFITKPINDMALMARVRSLLRLKMIMDEWRVRENIAGHVDEHSLDDLTPHDPEKKRRGLLISDDPLERNFVLETLAPLSVAIDSVSTISDGVPKAREGGYSFVMSSLSLQDEDGLMICPQIRSNEQTRLLPVVLLANEGDMSRVSKGLDLGANDYVLRPLDAGELLARTRTQLRQKELYDRLRKNYEDSLSMALVDPLTNTFNRRYLDTRLPKAVDRAIKDRKNLSVLMLDIDHFKSINDTFGHAAGDMVLKEVAHHIMNSLRPFDMVARVGGEEFMVVMPEASLIAATTVGERLRRKIESTTFHCGPDFIPHTVTVSIGGAELDLVAKETCEDLFNRSDRNLYKAKQTGRNKVIAE